MRFHDAVGRRFSRPQMTRVCAGALIALSVTGAGIERTGALSPAETLLEPATLRALDEELSGTLMRDHVAELASIHRVPASPGYHRAAELVMAWAKSYGLSEVHAETFPADGNTWFGTLRGNRGWRVEGGELAEVSPRPRRIASFDDLVMLVADNSETADVTAPVVDVGSGTSARDYEGRDVLGKLVLCDGSPGAAHRQAVEERGAAGLISYNSNQRTGWWRDDPDLVRWGHLDPRGRANTFALMISVRQARDLQQRLASGEKIVLRAVVRAHNDDTIPYETVTATIPGAEPSLGEIIYSCHFDHQKPAANDDASGCAAILEIGRAIKALVAQGRIRTPARTIRFVFPSEMTGTIAYLAKYPELAGRIRAAIHLDMVGGDPFKTRSVLHVTRSPWSVASITDDVAEIFARYVIDGAYEGAASGDFSKAVRVPGGSKDALWADFTPYESGSDHWIYQEGSFGIPTIYLRDWPDIYIHTNRDIVDNVEPTKLKRAAFIAAASGYYLANLSNRSSQGNDVLPGYVLAGAHGRLAEDARRMMARRAAAAGGTEREQGQAVRESGILMLEAINREKRRLASFDRFDFAPAGSRAKQFLNQAAANLDTLALSLGLPQEFAKALESGLPRDGDARVPVRVPEIKGPLDPTSEWVVEKAGAEAARLAIGRVPGGGDVTYEIVNFIDGRRTVSGIRDAVSAEFEPIDVRQVAGYLDLLAKIGAVRFK